MRIPLTVALHPDPNTHVLGTRLRLDDDLRASITWMYRVPGTQGGEPLGLDPYSFSFLQADDLVLVPLSRWDAVVDDRDANTPPTRDDPTVTMRCLDHIRDLHPVPDATLAEHGLADWLSVAVTVREMLQDPVFQVTVMVDPAVPPSMLRAAPIQAVELPVEGPLDRRVPTLAVDIPACADADFVAFRVELIGTVQLDVSVDEGAWPVALRALRDTLSAIRAQAHTLLNMTEDQIVIRDGQRDTLRGLIDQLDTWENDNSVRVGRIAALPPADQEVQFAEARGGAVQALASVNNLGDFHLLARRGDDGTVQLVSRLDRLRAKRLRVAYTDASRSVLRRPSLLLVVLSGILVLLAVRLTSAVDLSERDVTWLTRPVADRSFDDSREVLVGVLLFLPTFLYASLLRGRPESEARRRALGGYNRLLGVGFVAPVLPALMAVGYGGATQVAVVLVVVALIGVVLAAYGLVATSPSSLAKARMRVLKTEGTDR